MRDSVRDNPASELGDLWQDYDGFCQYPPSNSEDYLMCRRFSFSVKILAGGIFAVQTCVSTTTVDGRTLAEYYRAGDVATLAEMIEAKRANRLTRDSQPVGVRALRQFADGSGPARAIDLDDTEEILAHAKLAPDQQRSYERSSIRCRPFKQPCMDVPLSELRLILGSQITQDEHEETIIEPSERAQWMRKMRDFVHGADVYGQNLQLSENCIDDERFDTLAILPPAVRVRGANGRETLIPGATQASEADLRQRVRSRMDQIRKNGFLERRSINPVLALPSSFGPRRGERLKTDLEMIWAGQGIEATFATVYFQSAEEVRRAVEDGGHDAVLAVLPEGSRRGRSANDTHEQLKRRLDVPSQCIQHDNTLPPKWCPRSWHELTQADGRLARRIRQRYELCLGNLLVKHHCFPFAPQDAFHYNVHVGLDVGGVHNTHAVACIGYGFAQPRDGLFFRPEEIPIEVQKKEPIPTQSLFAGLLDLFDRIHSDLTALGITPDLGSVLFHRDGALLGEGDAWNERDALFNLCAELKRRRWIGDEARWTVAEILKTAEHWRLLRSVNGEIRNPLVGYAVFPFEDPNAALVATTGAPYLTQGTAHPLLVRISNISGQACREEVVRDVVWQADMCFTKPDMGMHLPWVLNVADCGALQLSKSYRLSGITA